MPDLISSHSLLCIAIGASAYLGVLHLWLARGAPPSICWVGVWAAFSFAFAAARLVQMDTSDPDVAVAAARVYAATAPLLLWSVCRLVLSIVERPARRFEVGAANAVSFGCAALALATPWFVGAQTVPSVDSFGQTYLGVSGGPGMPILGLHNVLALAWSSRELYRSTHLEPAQRRWLLGSLSVYAAMGAVTFASSLGWLVSAGVAEAGPLVVVVGSSQLVVMRQRRLERDLQQQVAERTNALGASERRYRDLVQNAPIGILSLDSSGELLQANARLLAMLGSTRDSFACAFNQ